MSFKKIFTSMAYRCLYDLHPAVTAASHACECNLLLIAKSLHELKMSVHLFYILLHVSTIYLKISSLFNSKSNPLLIPIFKILYFHFLCGLTNAMAYGTRRFNVAFTRALQ